MQNKWIKEQPICETDKYGTKRWYQNGVLHRVDGPAYISGDGTKFWLQNGKFHREDGPAYESRSGTKAWYQNGEFNRLDGPAIEWNYGDKEYWINGKEFSEQEFKDRTCKTNG